MGGVSSLLTCGFGFCSGTWTGCSPDACQCCCCRQTRLALSFPPGHFLFMHRRMLDFEHELYTSVSVYKDTKYVDPSLPASTPILPAGFRFRYVVRNLKDQTCAFFLDDTWENPLMLWTGEQLEWFSATIPRHRNLADNHLRFKLPKSDKCLACCIHC